MTQGEKIALFYCGFCRHTVRSWVVVLKQRLSRVREMRLAMNDTDEDQDDRADTHAEPPRVLDAEELFAGKREVWIELDGVRYRLRITRRGKLILQK